MRSLRSGVQYSVGLVMETAQLVKSEQLATSSVRSRSIPSALQSAESILSTTIGILNVRTLSVLSLWYTFSFGAIFLSKYIVDFLNVDLMLFSAIQFLVSAVMGLVNIRYPCGMYQSTTNTVTKKELKPVSFYKVMLFVGSMRFLVVYLGLVSLKYIAVSFTETIKSSAPLFTVIISRLMLKEKNGMFVQLSLIPIMLGLVLCSAYELSFTWAGFYAAMGTNLAECLQFVASKLSLSHDHHRQTPAEFQLYTCSAAVVAALVLSLFLPRSAINLTTAEFLLMVFTGLLYHFQTMMAWVLMEFLSPVTHSVCNTVKCALAVWISIPLFGNHMTLLSGVGTCIVIVGVLLYNKARNFEHEFLLLSLTEATPESSAVPQNYAAMNGNNVCDGSKISVDVNVEEKENLGSGMIHI